MLTAILVGSRGSGKSTPAKTLGQVICSTDKYVEEEASMLGVSYDKAFKLSVNCHLQEIYKVLLRGHQVIN